MPSVDRPRTWPPSARGMDHRADVGVGEEIDDVVLAGFDIDFDFGEAGDVGMSHAVARVVVACAAATRPWPASAATDALVILLTSAGASWPS